MAVNEVVVNGNSVINLRSDSVAPDNLAMGETAHDAAGNEIVGIAPKLRLNPEEIPALPPEQFIVPTDKTLSEENAPADAAETGKRISELKEDLADKASKSEIQKVWYGTQAEYDSITIKDQNTDYNIYEG